jgi:hypothetical protein
MKNEASMDPLLRRTLEARLADSGDGGDCLDAETLAAWADGALEPASRRRAEAHAADCARCQALLAAMAKTAPPPAAAPWWRVHTMRWLVPLAAGTAAIVLWLVVPQPPTDKLAEPAASSTVAVTPSPASSPAVPAPSAPAAGAAAEADRKAAGIAAAPSRDERASEKELRRQRADADAFAPAPLTAPAPPPPAPPETAARLGGRLGAAQERVGGVLNEAAGRVVIPSPDAAVQWRFTPGQGAVERTGDAGATWEAQAVPPGAALVAGAAPSPTVCWIAGRQGLVLITVDGRTWRRAAIPEPLDLVSVRAADDKTATVTASDGRRFETADGGASWRSLPQEFPAAPF